MSSNDQQKTGGRANEVFAQQSQMMMDKQKTENTVVGSAVAGLAVGGAATAGVSFWLNPKFYDLESKALGKLQAWAEKSTGKNIIDGVGAGGEGISGASSGGLISLLDDKFMREAAKEEAKDGSKLPEIILRRFGNKGNFSLAVGTALGGAAAIGYWAMKRGGQEVSAPVPVVLANEPRQMEVSSRDAESEKSSGWQDKMVEQKAAKATEAEESIER